MAVGLLLELRQEAVGPLAVAVEQSIRSRSPRHALRIVAVREIAVKTERKTQLIDITEGVRRALGNEVEGSAVLVFVPHTTASVTINEHADPNVARDLEMSLERIVEDGWPFKHWEAGDENAPSHIRATLIGPQVLVPLDGGRLALGTWQGIFFCEFDGPRSRKVFVSVLD